MHTKIKFLAAVAAVSVMSLSSYNVAYGEDHKSEASMEKHEKGGKHRPGHFFKKLDKNNDGKITKSEAITNAEERFSKMDTDGDGSVTREEAKEHHKNKKKHCKKKMKGDDKPE